MVNEKPFKLDMPFEEALRRFVRTDAKDLPEGARLRGKQEGRDKKKAGREPPGPPVTAPPSATAEGSRASGPRRARSARSGPGSTS